MLLEELADRHGVVEQHDDAAAARGKVTDREREVLQLLVQGATNRDIARRLSITENTVKVHLRNILEKLHLRNRQQAAAFAVSSGLVRLNRIEGDRPPARSEDRISTIGWTRRRGA
jgi:DNA-binding NarL/FixJ family response regulator